MLTWPELLADAEKVVGFVPSLEKIGEEIKADLATPDSTIAKIVEIGQGIIDNAVAIYKAARAVPPPAA